MSLKIQGPNGYSSEAMTTTVLGCGFMVLLTFAFTVLKVAGVVDWSWWWVAAPIWITFSLWFLAFGCCFLIEFIALVMKMKGWR